MVLSNDPDENSSIFYCSVLCLIGYLECTKPSIKQDHWIKLNGCKFIEVCCVATKTS